MADKNKYNEVKLALTVAKTGLTKAIRKLEECGKEMSKLEADLATASKVRIAALHWKQFLKRKERLAIIEING